MLYTLSVTKGSLGDLWGSWPKNRLAKQKPKMYISKKNRNYSETSQFHSNKYHRNTDDVL